MTPHGPCWLALALLVVCALSPVSRSVAQGVPAPTETGATDKPSDGAAAPAPVGPPQVPTAPAAASADPARPATWHTVTGPERSFTAELPAEPKYSTARMTTGTGSLYTLHQYVLEHGDAAYIVQTAVYPDDINVANPRFNLQGGLDTLAKGMEGAKWTSIDWLSHQGLTASDAVGARNGHAIRSFSVMKGRQVFTLIYAGTPGTARSDDVNRFVGSLRVGP